MNEPVNLEAGTEGIGEAEAARRLESMFGDDDDAPEGSIDAEANSQDDENPSGDDADSENQDGADDSTDGDDQPLYTVKVDGKELHVTLDELVAGYQKDADYRNKTAQVAEQRRAVDAERQAVVQERAQLSEALNRNQALLEAQLGQQPDWQYLLENDPQEYLRQQHLYQQRSAELQQVQQVQAQLKQAQQVEQAQQWEQYLSTEREQLLAKLPEWKDAARAKAEKAELRNFLSSHGFSDEEISGIGDHRILLAARKAWLFDQLTSKRPEAVKKVEKAPPKVIRSGSTEEHGKPRVKELVNLSAKTGRVQDAAAAIAALI